MTVTYENEPKRTTTTFLSSNMKYTKPSTMNSPTTTTTTTVTVTTTTNMITPTSTTDANEPTKAKAKQSTTDSNTFSNSSSYYPDIASTPLYSTTTAYTDTNKKFYFDPSGYETETDGATSDNSHTHQPHTSQPYNDNFTNIEEVNGTQEEVSKHQFYITLTEPPQH